MRFDNSQEGKLGATQVAPQQSKDVRNLQNDKPLFPMQVLLHCIGLKVRNNLQSMIIHMNINHKRYIKVKRILFLFIAISVSTCSTYSQNKTIKGRVISDQLETLPGVLIAINDTLVVGKTDVNGFFQIDIPLTVNKIFFKYVGLEQTNIELIDKCDKVEVIMMLSGTYDFTALDKVDILRWKRFNKLPRLHKEAFEKGMFKTEKACYKQEFLANSKE